MLTLILPALRGLMARGDTLPRLARVQPEGGEPLLTVPPGCDDAFAVLQSHVPPGTSRVTLDTGGTYEAVFTDLPGRAAGRIALVTGAAQGFGFEIACDLAAQGAWVALADINEAGVLAAAEQVNEACGRSAAVGVAVNVADPDSVRAAVAAAVTAFGGIDLLVSNAGVLRAGSVKTLPVKDLRFVTDVNYHGYFLMVQAVAPILALQHRAVPSRWFDIIQINSKSGLTGSNKNGAYAGSKFGGIGLTQSFALELVEDGIKVNSICPGNFYDGPLWSDPEKGLFKQYLDSGKVPGAKTFEDVKRFYESKVPMRRGCTTPDVMKALYYLMEQTYETGQAVPVTGGQVMLA
ncbi:MAG TPA: SDR family NAD(P)-dependent oxidoreductase [Kiritimatiellia bacterium]|jgi:sorbitol-6-phosphate 2-dehydrogenase|nr:SDR family NAD(P)-dependent oxidoreductase [Kiritimatiellia bacterium]HPW76009.1 SDR family NAD(P)-dependent oxidoreductase [Kiritimatiellia bacterium]HRU20178.1 SDR family NAD(P)-dependent oxidoreductase [Kiritimatiellia bacterium]